MIYFYYYSTLRLSDENDIGENRLHINKVKVSVFLFIAAGYKITLTIMAHCTYALATKSDVQEKLQRKVDELKERDINYDSVTKLTYMGLFI